MGSLTEEQAKEILAPYHPVLCAIVANAWAEWRKLSPEHRMTLGESDRVRANVLWKFMIDQARKLLEGFNVKVIERDNSIQFFIEERVLIRLKKLDASGISSSLQTQRSIDFYEQQPLDGIPQVYRLEVGYVLDQLRQSYADILVVARQGDAVVWKYSISNAAGATVTHMDESQATTDDGRDSRDRGARVRGKRTKDGDRDASSD